VPSRSTGRSTEPKKADSREWQKVKEQVPAAEPWGSYLDICRRNSIARCAREQDADPPPFLSVERNINFVFDLAVQLLSPRRVLPLCQSSAHRAGEAHTSNRARTIKKDQGPEREGLSVVPLSR
jgi:hypothetical protein